MNHRVHNQIVNFIWNIADDVLRDVYVRGKYRDVILPFTVLRRLDALLVPTKQQVLKTHQFLVEKKIDNKAGLTQKSGYDFYNTSSFTFRDSSEIETDPKFTALLNDPDNIDSNLEVYLDGFSKNVQDIISKFKLRNQLQTMREAGITHMLIEKFSARDINLTPLPATNSKGDKLPPLTNLGMGYVFEELIRKFNEENNEEAGEHFTPRDIVQLMTHLLFEPVKDQLKAAAYSIYDPACGSGGMLTEAERFAKRITGNKAIFHLFGQEVNPETFAICQSDMLIKQEKRNGRRIQEIEIAYGSTLSRDAFSDKRFEFMLSNPPYGKSWKIDYNAIVGERKTIKDHRFKKGVPRSSDGQLLFTTNMVAKMNHRSELGSRIAVVHNGSALFTGDAGSGESEIRKWFIENDWLEAIIGVPKNMFYNTGISTYIWVLNNKKPAVRRGKMQLIDATEIYAKMRKNLGNKGHELSEDQIERITNIYLAFRESKISKIFDNADFGFHKITVERPLRLKAQFSEEAVASLQYYDPIRAEMEWAHHRFGESVYQDMKPLKERILNYLEQNEIKLSPQNRKKLLDKKFWQQRKQLFETATRLMMHFGIAEYDDYNQFVKDLDKTIKKHALSISAADKKAILTAVSWRDETAAKVIRKKDKDGAIHYEADSQLRDTENVPLKEDIITYFEREVLPHVPDAWIDHDKTVVGYEISFTKYFYQYQPLRRLEEIAADILKLEQETEGLLSDIINN